MALRKSQKRVFPTCLRILSDSLSRGLSTTGTLRLDNRPLRLAIIGSGPAGFYTAYRVMSKIAEARIDMYESLPVPFGLVRYGVAPDHPEVKNCQDKFEEVGSSPRFQFLGNVSIGSADPSPDHCMVSLESLRRHYHAILFAYGASQDKQLGVPGESTLRGIYSARQFVGWYNGLPSCADLDPDLCGEEAVIVGHGNVALDVARILLEDIDVLRKTDIAEHALAQIAQSRIRRVHVVGRRGPMQGSFTIKEVRELMTMPQVAFHPVNRNLIPDDILSLPRASKRLMEVLLQGSLEDPATASKSWSLDSCLAPKAFIGSEHDPSTVAGIEAGITDLEAPFDPKSPIRSRGETVVLPSDVVFRSIGYKSLPLPGFAAAGIQFDEERGVVRNDGLGRITRLIYRDRPMIAETRRVSGMYCTGWVKRGPTGVIASTMQDAFTTGDAIIEDWLSGAAFLDGHRAEKFAGGWDAVRREAGPAAKFAVTWDQWRQIDKAEKDRGRTRGKEREKFTRIQDMLAVIQ